MKEAVLNFIEQKGLTIPHIHTEYEGGVICYIHFSLPKWDFFIYEIDETGDFANALVYSPFTHGTADHGLIPLKNFAEKYTEKFPNEFDFYAAKINEVFTPTSLVNVMKSKKNS